MQTHAIDVTHSNIKCGALLYYGKKHTNLCWLILADSSVQFTNNSHPKVRPLYTINRV